MTRELNPAGVVMAWAIVTVLSINAVSVIDPSLHKYEWALVGAVSAVAAAWAVASIVMGWTE